MPARKVLLLLMMMFSLSGCSNSNIQATIDPSALSAAVSTQLADLPTSTQLPTTTPIPPTQTPTASGTPTASQTPGTSPTSVYPFPYITWTPSTCDYSAFIADLDIVDYSFVLPGTTFTKTWRIKNIGTCTWTTDYRFQYISGDPMGADTIYLPRSVPPGETIDLSLTMTAPDIEEDYSNFWKLRNTAGEIFGTTFYVAIEVSKNAGKPSATLAPTEEPTATEEAIPE